MKPRVESREATEALAEIDEIELELTEDDIALWFRAHPDASPTGFALDFSIDPSALREAAADEPLVRLALYRIIALSESRLYTHVYGPKAVIQRVELFLPIETVNASDFNDMFVDTAG